MVYGGWGSGGVRVCRCGQVCVSDGCVSLVTSDVRYSFAELRDRAECIRLADVTKRIYFQGVFVCTCMSEKRTLYPYPYLFSLQHNH